MNDNEKSTWEQISIKSRCYPYAIGRFDIERFLLVGESIGRRCNRQSDDIILTLTLIKELEEFFNYRVFKSTRQAKVQNGQRKICLVRSVHMGDYHFFVQLSDGIWRHERPGFEPEIATEREIFGENEPLNNSFTRRWIFLLKPKGAN